MRAANEGETLSLFVYNCLSRKLKYQQKLLKSMKNFSKLLDIRKYI